PIALPWDSRDLVESPLDHYRFVLNLIESVKEKDMDTVWDESFYFNISDPSILPNLTLDAFVYNNVKGNHSRSFLGKASITGTSVVPYSDVVVLHYPLEKRGILSCTT
ncbi:FT-interacting protein 1, partial [Tanacetum coccineum]